MKNVLVAMLLLCATPAVPALAGDSNANKETPVLIINADGIVLTDEEFADYTPPRVRIEYPYNYSEVRDYFRIEGSCESGLTVRISGFGFSTTSASCFGSRFSAYLSVYTSSGSIDVTASQTDAAGNYGDDRKHYRVIKR